MTPRMKMTWQIKTIPRLKTDPKWRWPQKWIQSWFTWLGTILRSHAGWISIYDFIHPILCQKMNEQNEGFQDKTKDKITRQHSATFRYMCCILDSNARRYLASTTNLIQGVPQYCFHFCFLKFSASEVPRIQFVIIWWNLDQDIDKILEGSHFKS